jgi:hypothetical protein
MNKQKLTGLLFCAAGVLLARLDVFVAPENTPLFFLKAAGIALALTGLVVFAAGLQKTVKKVKACPACFTKNEATAASCKKCKKTFSPPT